MQSKAATVEGYLAELPPDRRAAISAVRQVILKNLDKQYAEGMQYGMIGYFVPHSVYPAGYHCDPKQPLPFIGLASQKSHMSVYLMGLYCGCGDPAAAGADGLTDHARWFQGAWTKAGKKLDMGKACVRFKKLEDVAMDVLGEAVKRMPAKIYIERYDTIRPDKASSKPASTTAKAKAPKSPNTLKKAVSAKKPATTKAATKASAKKTATKSTGRK